MNIEELKNLPLQEKIKLFKDVQLYFKDYWKYEFNFVGYYETPEKNYRISVFVGGDVDEIYRFGKVEADKSVTLSELVKEIDVNNIYVD